LQPLNKLFSPKKRGEDVQLVDVCSVCPDPALCSSDEEETELDRFDVTRNPTLSSSSSDAAARRGAGAQQQRGTLWSLFFCF
jgi:hypothetical protein